MANGTLNPSLHATQSLERPLGFWKAHWQGQGQLITAFWLIGFVGGLGVQFLAALLVWLAGVGSPGLSAPTMLATTAGEVAYLIYSLVAIWRCAFNTSWVGWGYLARGCVLLVPVNVCLAIFLIIYYFLPP